jgi:glucose/arabinose dehydrogenase
MRMRRIVLVLIVAGIVIVGTLLWLGSSVETDLSVDGTTPEVLEEEQAVLRPIELEERVVALPDGGEASFRLPKEFQITVAAEELGKARFMAMSPDGRLFVPDLVNYNLSHDGKVYILEDFNKETGKFETKHTYLSGLRGSNSVAFYTDEDGKDWLYLALTGELIRYPYNAGDTEPSGEGEIVATFPDWQSPGEESVVWHITRTLLFHDDLLYVSVGSGCNSCEHPETEIRGAVLVMKPDGSEKQVYAYGLRNAVGLEWSSDGLYATENGADHLGSDAPDDLLYKLEDGEHYGWPYCYELDGEIIEDNHQNWEESISCDSAPLSFASFQPHTAPLGIRFFETAHPALENTFLVALHGSFDLNHSRNGYSVMRVNKEGKVEIFMDGFLSEGDERAGRPVDFFQYDENSFFLSDDFAGVIYYVFAN